MFFRKPLRGKNTRAKSILGQFIGGIDSVTDEMFLSQRVSKVCYNASGATGALRHRFGFSQLCDMDNQALKAPQKIKKVWFFKNDGFGYYLAIFEDNRLYRFDNFGQTDQKTWQQVEGGIEFLQIPTAVHYKLMDTDVMFFSSQADGMYCYDGVLLPVSEAPKLTSMAVHYERLFGVTGTDNILWFSDDLNPTNWNISLEEGGFIEFADEKGKILCVVSFLDYLYLFREFGITRISAYAEQENFNVTQIYASSGKIFANTVTICGSSIFFLSQDGIFCFNGSDVKKMLGSLDGFSMGVNNQNAVSGFVRGRYLLAMKMDFSDNTKVGCENSPHTNNVLLAFDLFSGEQVLMRGIDIGFLGRSSQSGMSLICLNGKYADRVATLSNSGCLFDESLPKNWTTPCTDFGYSAVDKLLKSVILYTKYDITLTVICDGNEVCFDICGSDKAQKVSLNVIGQQFSFCYNTQHKQMHVVQPRFVYSVIGSSL